MATRQKASGDCPICYEDIDDNELRCNICDKMVCVVCIQKIMKSNLVQCPLCRTMNACTQTQMEMITLGSWTKLDAKQNVKTVK